MKKIETFVDGEDVNVIVETPAGSRTKYAWKPDREIFEARQVLPLGLSFPFDFGFIAKTKAGDGDPLDACILADAPLAVGTLVACRVIGAFSVKTDDERNDRVVVVPQIALRGAEWTDLTEIGGTWCTEIGDFLRSYVEREGRRYELVDVVGRQGALALVRDARSV
ncbi:MAG: inorganic diphosphatase [Kofleriaceae bacterium]